MRRAQKGNQSNGRESGHEIARIFEREFAPSESSYTRRGRPYAVREERAPMKREGDFSRAKNPAPTKGWEPGRNSGFSPLG